MKASLLLLLSLVLFRASAQDIPPSSRVRVKLVNACKENVSFKSTRTMASVTGYGCNLEPGRSLVVSLVPGDLVTYSPRSSSGWTRLDTVRRTGQVITTSCK